MPTPRVQSWGPDLRRGLGALRLLALTFVWGVRLAHAQPGGEPSTHQVDVMLVGESGRDPELGRRIASWFDAEQFRVRVRSVVRFSPEQILSPRPDEAVSAWVLFPRWNRARIYFVMAMGPEGQPTYLLRDLALDDGLDEMGAERIAQVLHLSTVALVDGQAASRREEVERMLSQETTAPVSRDAVEPAPPAQPAEASAEPPATPGPERRDDREPMPGSAAAATFAIEAGGGYGISARGDEGIWHGPRATLLVRFAGGLGVQALLQSALPTTRRMQDLELEFSGGQLGIAGSYQHRVGSRTRLEWSAGPGLEIVHYRPERSLSSDVHPGRGDTELRPAAVAAVSAVFRNSAPMVVIAAQCAVPLLDSHYDVVDGDDREAIGRSLPAVPALGVEARF